MTQFQYQLPSATLITVISPDCSLSRYLEETRRLLIFRPEILSAIERDLDANGLKKKAQRWNDHLWLKAQPCLPGQADAARCDKVSPLPLMQGRPRMSPRSCFFFWMLAIYSGGIKSRLTIDRLKDSKTVELFLLEQGCRLPSVSTIMENVNAISEATRTMILDAQISLAREEGLDDFEKMQLDSTHVDANTSWPTDSALIWKWSRRLNKLINKLKSFGLAFAKVPEIDEILADLKRLDFQINCCATNQAKKRKILYLAFLEEAENASQLYSKKLLELTPQLVLVNLRPSKMERLKRLIQAIHEDLDHLYEAIGHCHERISEGKTRSAKEKVLSIADPDAAFLKKGSRPARIGYIPQLARSGKGLVTAVIVPQGNPGDAPMLQPLCDQSFRRTGVIPKQTSADGCYASKKNRKWQLEKGVEKPSFSSSKGKAITPKEDWDSLEFLNLRKWRSAVEALMSQLKDQVNFGRVIRRGLERVRAELVDKVLAFNFMRLSILRS